MDMAYPVYFQALTKTGAADKIPAVAESALKNLPENEDLLATLAESALAKKDSAKALGLCREGDSRCEQSMRSPRR